MWEGTLLKWTLFIITHICGIIYYDDVNNSTDNVRFIISQWCPLSFASILELNTHSVIPHEPSSGFQKTNTYFIDWKPQCEISD